MKMNNKWYPIQIIYYQYMQTNHILNPIQHINVNPNATRYTIIRHNSNPNNSNPNLSQRVCRIVYGVHNGTQSLWEDFGWSCDG